MIAKHIALRSLKKSDFAALVSYLTDGQGKTARLGPVTIRHCEAATLEAALAEVLATQGLNTRAQGDKTYHLLIAFAPGEHPSADTLKAIEARICEGLGFAEHQRISVVHHDTDNLHVHIAINTIHPTRHTLHAPYQAYRTLAELCTVLERDFALERVNHQPRRRSAEASAADLEHHAGIESLASWIQRTCLDAIRGAPAWGPLHQLLREHGLELRAHANGFIFEAADGTRVKASTVARDLSKPKLEARFGPFEPSSELQTQPRRQYQKPPVPLRVNTAELYARYQADRQNAEMSRTAGWREIRARKARRLEAAKRMNRLRRALIKRMGGGRLMKKLLYAQAHQRLRQHVEALHRQYRTARQRISARFPRHTWADWLRHQALAGDAAALAALRARKTLKGLQRNTLQGDGAPRPGPLAPVDTITKQGTIVYRVGRGALRDDGTALQVAREASPEDLQAALRLAIARYGERLTVNGTTEFKQQIVQAAAAAHLPLTFAAAALERRRQALLMKESNPEQPERPPHRGGAHRRGARQAQSAVADPHPTGHGGGAPDGRSLIAKPNVGRPGRVPPPESRHRLRTLSQLGVVRITRGGEVLLPGDVPRHLEPRGAQSPHPLRWGVLGARLTPEQRAAAERYLAEREQKRRQGLAVPKHAPYHEGQAALTYAGTRNVAGQPLALLKSADAVLVLPIDAATARRLKRLALGDAVTVTSRGAIKTGTRRRR